MIVNATISPTSALPSAWLATAVHGDGNVRRSSTTYNPMNTAACSAVAATNITSRGSAAVTMNCCPNAPARNPTIDFASPPMPMTPLDSAS